MGELVDRDEEHLNLLSLFHYITAGVTFVFGSFPLIHVAIGVFMMFASHWAPEAKDGPPAFVGAMFAAMGGAFVTAGWTLAALHYFTARSLKQRRRYLFCVIVSGISTAVCMFSNGVVGVATLIVLSRASVKKLFETRREVTGVAETT